MDPIIMSTEDKMQKSLEALKKKFSGIRTGRASPALVENLMVEYYGTSCALKTLASISVPESRTITIQPYDKAAAKDIEKAVQKSNLGINPKSEGGRVILSLPQLTEDRRKELTRVVKSAAEEAKVSLRNIRRDIMEELKVKKSSKELSEDAEKLLEEEVQAVLKKYTDQIDSATAAKQKEILDV